MKILRVNNFRVYSFTFFVVVMAPVFLSLNFSSGVRFDAGPFNYLGTPSLPLSLALFPFLLLVRMFYFRVDVLTATFLCLAGGYLCLNLWYQPNYRPVFLFLGMALPFLNYSVIRTLVRRHGDFDVAVDNFYFALVFVVLTKSVFDVFSFGSISTTYFITSGFVIYNYYDYFSFVYFLSILLSFKMILNRRYILLSLAAILVSVACITLSFSRLFLVLSMVALPLFLCIHYVNLSIKLLISLTLLFVVVVTVFFGVVDVQITDLSFVERVEHWKLFFESFTPLNLIFPFFNEYRTNLDWGSFHNEWLEIYSYFGVSILLYFGIILRLVVGSRKPWRDVAAVIVVGLSLGMLVQLNFTNLYLCMIWSSCLAVMGSALKPERLNR